MENAPYHTVSYRIQPRVYRNHLDLIHCENTSKNFKRLVKSHSAKPSLLSEKTNLKNKQTKKVSPIFQPESHSRSIL